MRREPHLPRPYNPIQFYTTLYNSIQYKKLMKKSYIAPQTEAMEILANNVLMASPGGSGNFDMMYGSGGDGGGMG